MSKTEIISEIGINHNGDLDTAFRLIDVAASAGVDYVKFQKRDVDLVYMPGELAAPRQSPWGITNGDQKRGLEFGTREYMEIDRYCKARGIRWFFSVWDLNSLEFSLRFDHPFVKVPSALITDKELLSACRYLTDRGVILSTGMSTWEMVDAAVEVVGTDKIACIMHCTSTYPSKPDELNLNCIASMRWRYPWAKIGFSNHNPGVIYMPVAVAMGAEMIEYHSTLDRSMYGSDQAASIEPEGTFKLVKYVRGVDMAMGSGEKYILDSEIPILKKLRRAA